MADALVGGAFLSGFINVLFDRFLTTDAVNLVLGKKLGSDLVERLKISLLAAEALVDDAEYKQLGDERVREWLNCLRDAVYVADDLLDDVLTKAATQKEVHSFWSISFHSQDREMVDKIEGVVTRIEFLEKKKDFLGLQKNTKDNNLSSSSWRASTSLVEGKIYGREDDHQALTKIINDSSETQLSVIPIVGMGGVGKTTLAKQVYNNKEGFDLKVWVCISETFDVLEITRKTIEEITKSTCTLGSLNLLQIKLKEILSEKKFLIVLDDVWSDDVDIWKKFITRFHFGAKGSTILLTTCIQEVASVVQTCPSYFLNELSEDYCWLLFADSACFPKSNGDITLEEIGRRIVKKCKGLPLAVETLGCLLRGKGDVKEWNAVLTSDIWEFSVKRSKIIPALLISYFQLPAHLKRCFVYCSLYPKDYGFVAFELVSLWIAEDLLRPLKKGETLEEVGYECFDELYSRLFFKDDGTGLYKMHDLLHDLAIFLAGDFYGRLEEHGKAQGVSTLTRHLSYEYLHNLTSENLDSISKVESLRTFLPTSCFSHSDNIDGITSFLISKLKRLRVLSFCYSNRLNVLPDSISELTYLRYLNLSGQSIKTLPESLCDLHNLQTLKLNECSSLIMLPNGMHKLVNLQHLYIRGTCLKEMPRRMSKLKQLRTLCYFIVGKQEDNGIQELGGLSHLLGLFEIKKLENIVDAKQARSARIIDKECIYHLFLEWSSGDDLVSNTQIEREILDSLQPQNRLKNLRIEGYKGTIFPNWVGHCSYNNMTHVSLKSCNNCCMLPSLGQLPSLRSLSIEGFGQLKSIGIEFYKDEGAHDSSLIASFPSLESLEFQNMPCWEVWHSPNLKSFPQLTCLSIENCPSLKGDMLSQVFFRVVSSMSDVSRVRKLIIGEDHEECLPDMSLDDGTLSVMGGESVVEYVFKAMSINHLTSLQEIYIAGCTSVVSFPGNCLPESLKTLKVIGCRKLEFPKQQQQQQQKFSLEKLKIVSSCDSLNSLSLDAFPNLKTLKIIMCENVESVSMSRPPHTALHRLIISGCPKFVSFPGEGLAAPNLTHFDVSFCEKLEALPRDMKTLLPSLQSLEIEGCPEICRLPEGGLPPNLTRLRVGGCEKQLRGLSSMGNFNTREHCSSRVNFELQFQSKTVFASYALHQIQAHAQAIRAGHLFATAG